MTRALLSVGCNVYDASKGYGPLNGAEPDASRVFSLLTDPEIGAFDPTFSSILLSPDSATFIDELKRILSTPLEMFTLFFAGHGDLANDSMYLCLRDTGVGDLWKSAIPLSQVFGMIAGAQPRRTNLIVDACFAGGLVGDLASIIKPGILGAAGSPSVTLLAMSSMDKGAGETPEGGFGTNALIDCLTGNAFVQSSSRSLDLAEIGLVVSKRVRRITDQAPALWVLHRQGTEAFCRNPHYNFGIDALRGWNPRLLISSFEPVVESHARSSIDVVQDVERLTSGLIENAQQSRDVFFPPRVRALRLVALLSHAKLGGVIEEYLQSEAREIAGEIKSATRQLAAEAKNNPYCLLTRNAAFADLFYLPLRITDILGWIGAAFHLDRLLGDTGAFPLDELREFCELLTETYPGAISCMSERQAPGLLVAATALHGLGLQEAGEKVLGSLFASAVATKGNIADERIEASEVMEYLLRREEGNFEGRLNLLARPTESLMVLLKLSTLFGLDGVFDESMAELDHLAVNAFVSYDLQEFGKERIDGGQNHTFLIGHDFWKVSDLDDAWSPFDDDKSTQGEQCAALLSSLIFPDRTPWFLFKPITGTGMHPLNGLAFREM